MHISRFLLVGCGSLIAFTGNTLAGPSPTPTPTPIIFDEAVSRLVADPIRPRVYASSSGRVIVIDTTTMSIIKSVSFGAAPEGLSISVDGSKLWIADAGGDPGIRVLDLNTLERLPSLPVPLQLSDVEEGLGGRLYVTPLSGSPRVWQVDANTGAFQAPLGGNHQSVDGRLEISPDRNILFYGDGAAGTCSTLNKFKVATENASLLQEVAFCASFASIAADLKLSHGGQLIVYPMGRGNGSPPYTTFEIPTADLTSVNGTFNVGARPGPAVFSNDDTLLYHGAYTQSAIKIFDTATFNLVGTISLPHGIDGRQLAIDRSGRWLFASTGTNVGPTGLRVFDTGRSDVVPTAALRNVATRLRVGLGDNALIGGVIITGTNPKRVIIRGIGPSLSAVNDRLPDPIIELHQGDAVIATNDNWKLRPDGSNQQVEIEATGLAPTNDLESALVAILNPGAYTAILRGQGNTTGVGVVDAYDLDPAADSTLANISTRGLVDTGDNVMIAGIIVGPANGANGKIVVRALGPTLSDFGIQGALQDTTLDLINSYGVTLRSNNDWRDTQEAEIEALGLQPPNDRESALLQTIAPGSYTAIVRGASNTTGVGLVEVYKLQ